MRILLAVAIILGLGTSLQAASVVVRSGDHDGFTRIVLHLPEEIEWRTVDTPQGMRLEFPSGTPEFDLAQAFSRIGRERVANIERAPSGLAVSFGCPCEAEVFASGKRMLVIDVSDATRAEVSSPYPKIDLPDPAKVLARSKAPQVSKTLKVAVADEKKDEPSADTKIAKQRLLKQLGRAASMGLVELSIPDEAVDVIDPSFQDSGDTGLYAHQAGLDASPVVSSEMAGEIDEHGVSDRGLECPPESLLDPHGWAQADDFSSGLRLLRQKLGGEISPIDRAVALQLAKHYLAYGFGAEAQNILPLVGDASEVQWLQFISNIVDERKSQATQSLSRYVGCPTSVAMWAMLASDQEHEKINIDTGPILRAFSDLTEPLQDILAPRLGQVLIAYGKEEAAHTILRIVNRRTAPLTAEIAHLDAQLRAESGDMVRAKEKLEETVRADAPISPIALAELVEGEVRLGRALSSETVDLLASYYQQHRRDKLAPRLLTSLILANALASQFDESWSLLENAPDEIRTSDVVKSDFALALAEHGSDLDVLRYGAILARRAGKLTDQANLALAKRLNATGFPDLARQFLVAPFQGGDERERKLFLAQIAFEQENFLAAKAYLLGLVDPMADALNAEILTAEAALRPAEEVKAAVSAHTLGSYKISASSSKDLRENLRARLQELSLENPGVDEMK